MPEQHSGRCSSMPTHGREFEVTLPAAARFHASCQHVMKEKVASR